MNAWQTPSDSRLPRFSLDRRITVVVILLTALVIGAVALTAIPVELIPRGFTNPGLLVIVPWPDAPPREVEEKITLPLQDELATVKGLDRLISVSRARGALVFLMLKQGTDMDIAYREVRDRIERARREFPSDVDQVFIRKDDSSGIPVYVMGVAVDPEITDSYDLIQNEIILPLERIDGVASVEANGLEEKEILIELDRDRVAASGLNIYRLAQDLSQDNFTMASGDVHEGGRKLLLRSIARYSSLKELEDRPVAPTVRLRDVARVSYEEPDKQYRVRAMSRPAYALVVFKEGEANAQEVCTRIQKTVDGMASNPRLDGIESVVLFSQGAVITQSLRTLLTSGLVGGGIAAVVLFVFLRRGRLTLVICLSIPLSMLIAVTVMYFADETINILSMLSLMVCVGLLVDNSVVVAENIHRLLQEGLPRRQACIRGASEIALAITMSTLTTIVVFLPVALVEGNAQFFFMRMALPISVALLASLLVALIFVPLSVYTTLSDNGKARSKSVARRSWEAFISVVRIGYAATFHRIRRRYVALLQFFLIRRLDLILVLLLVFVITGAASSRSIRFVDVQDDERSGFELSVEMPPDSSLEETEAWFLAAERQVETHAEELDLEGWFLFHRKDRGELQGWLKNPRTTGLTAREITEKVMDMLPPKPGIHVFTGDENQTEEGRGESLFIATLYGEDADLLELVAKELEDVLGKVDGVLGVQRGFERTPSELGLVLDRERAHRLGVNPRVVAGVVSYALRGTPLPRHIDNGKEIPVRVRFREEDREGLAELSGFPVPSASGAFLPLSSVTDPRMLPDPGRIVRRNKRVARTITLELKEGTESETRTRLDALTSRIDLPEGLSFGAPPTNPFEEDIDNLRFAGVLSVVFIYLLMGFLFESFILPLSIILTIPLASIGVIWIHILSGRDIDFLGAVGIVLLIGVVVNNGIVLIDYVNRLRGKGMSRLEAITSAADLRFRPIMMTAITTIGGLLPLAFAGRSEIGLSYTSFSLTLIGGMTTATLLTLLVVPVFYTLFDDLRLAFGRTLRRVVGQRRSKGEARPATA